MSRDPEKQKTSSTMVAKTHGLFTLKVEYTLPDSEVEKKKAKMNCRP